MPRSRGSSDLPQRPSPRAPLHLRTTACSEANALHRLVVERTSPKLDDRRSPRSPLHEIQKKRGTKVADLEIKLSKAQEELKKLRDRLASAEAAKLDAEQALQKAKKQIPSPSPAAAEEEKPPSAPLPQSPTEEETSPEKSNLEQELKLEEESSVISPATTEVLEVTGVPTEATRDEKEDGRGHAKGEEAEEKVEDSFKHERDATDAVEEEKEENEAEKEVVEVPGSTKPAELPESPEVVELKNNLFEREREVEFLLEENAIFKRKAKEEAEKISAAARAREEELTGKLRSAEEELKESRAKADRLAEQLETAQDAKAALEDEMKRLKVQTGQWRKAAESAASMLADGDWEFGGRRASERCGSMDKHVGGGVFSDWGSSLMAGEMEEDGGGRRKAGPGIRMFGDLWKKKGQQK